MLTFLLVLKVCLGFVVGALLGGIFAWLLMYGYFALRPVSQQQMGDISMIALASLGIVLWVGGGALLGGIGGVMGMLRWG